MDISTPSEVISGTRRAGWIGRFAVRVILGLLTLLAGFEIIYAAVESSELVAAALAVVNLGLALTGAYLLSALGGEEAQ